MIPPHVIGSLLHHCSKTRSLRQGLSLHAAAFKSGLHNDIIISNHIINMYAKCGCMPDACQKFEEMHVRNLVSWSAMISGYNQLGQHSLALGWFSRLELLPNDFLYSSALSACTSLFALVQGQQIHAQALKTGHASIPFASNALILMYMKCDRFNDALLMFNGVVEPNVVSYNALITGFVENRQQDKGFEVFRLMFREGVVPDRISFGAVSGVCNDSDDMHRAGVLHCQMIKLGLDLSAFGGNVIVTMYSKLSIIKEAEKAFRLIENRDLISWNAFLSACSHCNEYEKALTIFKEMLEKHNVSPDDFTFATILAACGGVASIHYGVQIHAHLMRTKHCIDVGVGNALVNMYAKCGFIGKAYSVFRAMNNHNLVSWNTIIAAFGNHGLGGRALKLFEDMKKTGIKPDSVTFVGILSACNHAGLVDEGQVSFDSMKESYGISPDIEHFSCLIDLLGRAGRLCKAEEYMKKFHFGHDPVVLGSMLSACRLHGDVERGERMASLLLQLLPTTSSPYVLLANLYASDEMWDVVAETRKMLKGSGLRKEPGHSLIDVKGNFEKFTMQDFSHSRIDEIKGMLRIFNWEVNEECFCHLTWSF